MLTEDYETAATFMSDIICWKNSSKITQSFSMFVSILEECRLQRLDHTICKLLPTRNNQTIGL